MDEWYTAESDSEDIAAAIREDGQEATFDEEEDPKCPPIQFSAAEERLFCIDLRSALVVKALGRHVGVNQTPVDEPQRDALYGEWMIAKRKPRQPSREQPTRTNKEGGHMPQGKGQPRNSAQGSRFDVLRGDDMQENSIDQPAPVGGVAIEEKTPNTHVNLKNKSKALDVGTNHAAPMQTIPLERASSLRGPSIECQQPKTPRSAPLNVSSTADDSETATNPIPAALVSEGRKVPPDDNGLPKGPRKAHSGETRNVSTTSIDGSTPSAN
ncbi:unnamed protein product [Linum trigynum]|uniref:Uncharacterized protein n=1 Tax=Linum trigynum TaxID=586398 RepID=A0AAV2FFA1_9ROSI